MTQKADKEPIEPDYGRLYPSARNLGVERSVGIETPLLEQWRRQNAAKAFQPTRKYKIVGSLRGSK